MRKEVEAPRKELLARIRIACQAGKRLAGPRYVRQQSKRTESTEIAIVVPGPRLPWRAQRTVVRVDTAALKSPERLTCEAQQNAKCNDTARSEAPHRRDTALPSAPRYVVQPK